jgi:hypothetical protein
MKSPIRRTLCSLVLVALMLCTSCVYMKMNPPPDADKAVLAGNNSCWLATASNMLAGAGYGNGTTVQARANDIYGNMTAHFGTADGGWTDTALSWWLGSGHNTWTTNPYSVVTVYGNKSPKYPWADVNGAQYIGNQLRECNFVGLSISWPTNAAGVIGSGGHAITAWGDLSGDGTLTGNPGTVRLTDSDNDTGGDVQGYVYDTYTSPNPGGANEGNGWYINYDPNHPYIKHIVVLSAATNAAGNRLAQKVVGSYRIHQRQERPATDLHYRVGTDVDILSYKTTIDWSTGTPPSITEATPRRSLTVDWDLSAKSVPYCTWVTITMEFILPVWNAIQYNDVRFTYPGLEPMKLPDIRWEMKTPFLRNASTIRNVTGGYVIGAFDIVETASQRKVADYRFVHQYSYNQSPEEHTFILAGPTGFAAANFRFGHSYGSLDTGALWGFEKWMTRVPDGRVMLGAGPVEVPVVWTGLLPYPEGEDIRGRIPDIKKGLFTTPEKE